MLIRMRRTKRSISEPLRVFDHGKVYRVPKDCDEHSAAWFLRNGYADKVERKMEPDPENKALETAPENKTEKPKRKRRRGRPRKK